MTAGTGLGGMAECTLPRTLHLSINGLGAHWLRNPDENQRVAAPLRLATAILKAISLLKAVPPYHSPI